MISSTAANLCHKTREFWGAVVYQADKRHKVIKCAVNRRSFVNVALTSDLMVKKNISAWDKALLYNMIAFNFISLNALRYSADCFHSRMPGSLCFRF